MEERKETILTGVEELKEYLRENGDEKTVINVILELEADDRTPIAADAGMDMRKGETDRG